LLIDFLKFKRQASGVTVESSRRRQPPGDGCLRMNAMMEDTFMTLLLKRLICGAGNTANGQSKHAVS